MKLIAKVEALAMASAVVIAAIMAYFMRSIDMETGTVYDGLGRVLSEPPLWARLVLTSELVWAGTGWHILDTVCFFGGILAAIAIYNIGDNN